MGLVQQPFDGFYHSSSAYECGPYEPSNASSASSSQASIFSEEASIQSSIASSISDDFRYNQEDARDRALAHTQVLQKAAIESYTAQSCKVDNFFLSACQPPPSYADVTSVPKQQQQLHPRRAPSRNQKPPSLPRQCERKVSFVENLVDSATQMVEVIWPLSDVLCKGEGSSEKGVLPLRTYIEETLRRSKTSYSTLQVALYYLVLIKPFVPKRDFTQEQRMDCPASRALMCGRRMFLAALILASKYLQDRNYSAKAWSKMSGLKVCEINSNERSFLSKVQWKLHIPEPVFKRWTEVVLDFTPTMPPPSPGYGLVILPPSWKAIIPLLTPELDKVPITGLRHNRSVHCMGNYGLPTPTTPTRPATNFTQLESMSQEGTPTPTTVLPRFLEPKLDMEPPPVPRMGPLPTPQMTPSSVASSTPAVSAFGYRRPSISCAMAMAQQTGFNRCTMDAYPGMSSRRPSVTSTASNFSSPESMISDRSRSSRASSISSISTVSTTSSLAPIRTDLARLATCRNARLPMPPPTVDEEKENITLNPIITNDGDVIVASPEPVDFSISEKVLSRPDKHTKYAPQVVTTPASIEKSRKRNRNSHGGRRSNLQEEIRYMLEEHEDENMDLDEETLEDIENVSPSPATDYTRTILSRSNSAIHVSKEAQPPAELSRSGGHRLPVRSRGEKRRCCSTAVNPVGYEAGCLYGEVA